MSALSTVDINSDGTVTTINVMITEAESEPEFIAGVVRALSRAGVSVDFAQGNDVLYPYSSGTQSLRATVAEWVASL